MPDSIRARVVYALPDSQWQVELELAAGTSVDEAVRLSGFFERYPSKGARLNCAIYGRLIPLTHIVAEGDRIEILRPLLIDPKEQRRRTAARHRRDSKTS